MGLSYLDKLQVANISKEVEKCANINELLNLLKQARNLMKSCDESDSIYSLVAYIYHLLDDDKTSYKYYCKASQKNEDEVDYLLWIFITSILSGTNYWKQYKELVFNGETNLHKLAQGEYYLKLNDTLKAVNIANYLYDNDNFQYNTLYFYVKCLNACEYDPNIILDILNSNQLMLSTDTGALIYLKTLFRSDNIYECKRQCKKVIVQDSNSLAAQTARKILETYKKDYQKENNKVNIDNMQNGDIKRSSRNLEDAVNKINSLIGLNSVKEQIVRIIKIIEYNKIRKKILNLMEEEKSSYHFVFSGNPGTGKTTVARLLCDIFYYLGCLEKGQIVETDRSGLVGQFIGETAQKTKKTIDSALGGILFIDEAYSLYKSEDTNSKDFGLEAIEVLVKSMEDYRNEFIVILAGYTDNMNQLMKSNPGLKSRFNKFISFPDYTEEELLSIAKQIAFNKHYFFTEEAEQAFLEKVCREKVDDKFGNARCVRNIMNDAFEEKASISLSRQLTEEELISLFPEDFGVDVKQSLEEKAKIFINELKGLVGLENAKKEIQYILKLIEYQKQETGTLIDVLKQLSLNIVFSGNPGTGKTTVARLYGQILKGLGVLKKGQLIEVTRADLVGQWVGHTAKLTREKCHEAYGGILFIDEAYSLCYGPDDNFGREAIDTLIKEMEDNRDKLIIIFAGYTKNMEQLISTNPGFKSRINKTLVFDDYSSEEMLQIFKLFAKKQNFSVDSNCDELLLQKFSQLLQTSNEFFGNGRDVRKVFEMIKINMIYRVQEENISGKNRRTITNKDIK